MGECKHMHTMADYEKGTVICINCGADMMELLEEKNAALTQQLTESQEYIKRLQIINSKHTHRMIDKDKQIEGLRGALEEAQRLLGIYANRGYIPNEGEIEGNYLDIVDVLEKICLTLEENNGLHNATTNYPLTHQPKKI